LGCSKVATRYSWELVAHILHDGKIKTQVQEDGKVHLLSATALERPFALLSKAFFLGQDFDREHVIPSRRCFLLPYLHILELSRLFV
jgi:hypothetical protein